MPLTILLYGSFKLDNNNCIAVGGRCSEPNYFPVSGTGTNANTVRRRRVPPELRTPPPPPIDLPLITFDITLALHRQGSFPTKRKRFPAPPPPPPPPPPAAAAAAAAAAPVQVACLFWKLRTVAFQTTAAAISTLHPGNRQYLVCVLPPPTVPRHPSDGGRVKEHPFGVCDACRWPCRGKSRVAALNCTVAPNTCPTAGPNVRPTNTN
ncbi:hypothetical protein K0M31_002447 [Melipona bicolor]|uniref:Uncharacterized protein n=1 Tax=Melipona bicolor TaxID=60889 RepID=A0AA40GHJ6_9HYME|nr:hypothetical protein K0M31_002447 [Melipona bicolor]